MGCLRQYGATAIVSRCEMACRSTTYECYPIDDESFMMVSNRGKRKEEEEH